MWAVKRLLKQLSKSGENLNTQFFLNKMGMVEPERGSPSRNMFHDNPKERHRRILTKLNITTITCVRPAKEFFVK